MSKKDAKVSEAQLPMPPAVEAFIGALEEWKGKKPGKRQRKITSGPRGSVCVYNTSFRSILRADFQ